MAHQLIDAFRANVEALLTKRKMSRSELAERLGCTPSYVTQVLGGHRGVGLEAVENFAKALGVKPETLLRVAAGAA